MKKFTLTVPVLLCLTAIVMSLLSASASPNAREDVKDMTKSWAKLFGITGKLEVSNGLRDARAAASDGAITYSFDAKLKELGAYNFTFLLLDDDGQAYQAHTVRVAAGKHYRSSTKRIVSPEGVFNQATLCVQPDETIGVQWLYNPGGEGIPGGWILKNVVYTQTRSGVPGYKGRFAPQ